MAASVVYDRLSGLRDVDTEHISNGDVLVWVSSTGSWNPRPYNDGSGDSESLLIGSPVVGGQPNNILYIDSSQNLNQLKLIAQSMIENLVYDLGLKAPKVSPYLTGTPMAVAPDLTDNSLQIATTGYVQGQGFEQTANKGQPFGYASLDSAGKVPFAQLPASVARVLTQGVQVPIPSSAVGTKAQGSQTPPGGSRRSSRGAAGEGAQSLSIGMVQFPVAISDSEALDGSLFKGSSHRNKLCYKDDDGIVHELYE